MEEEKHEAPQEQGAAVELEGSDGTQEQPVRAKHDLRALSVRQVARFLNTDHLILIDELSDIGIKARGDLNFIIKPKYFSDIYELYYGHTVGWEELFDFRRLDEYK